MKFPDDPDKYAAKWFWLTVAAVTAFVVASYTYTVFF